MVFKIFFFWRRELLAEEKTHLDVIWKTGGIHARSNVDSVAPDVKLGLPGTDDPGDDGPDVDADAHGKVVVRILVDVVQPLAQAENVLDEERHEVSGRVRVVLLDPELGHEAHGRHVSRADCFDLVYRLELVSFEQVVKVCYDLVEEAQALHALVVCVQLHVELVEVCDGREHHPHSAVAFVVKLLRKENKKYFRYKSNFKYF